MKKKVTKILSALTAIVLTVLSVMMVMPVEAKAEDYPVIMLNGLGEWGLDGSDDFAPQNQGSCTINLSADDDAAVIAVVKIGYGMVTVHFLEGSPVSVSGSPSRSPKTYNKSKFSSLGESGTVPVYWKASGSDLYFSAEPYATDPTEDPKKDQTSAPAHVHSFKWQTITEPTQDADGLEGEMCSCGAVKNTQPISAMAYSLNTYANSLINAAKPSQTVTFEFGEWNSFPKSFMEKLVEKNGQNVTFVFHYKWNHVKQEITIPAGTPIDLNFDWYGPAKMAELYGMN